MRTATMQLIAGIALGMVLGLLASGPLQPLLSEVAPRDPWFWSRCRSR